MKKQLLLMWAMSLQFATFAQYEIIKNKNKPNGYAGINGQGKIDTSRLPKVNVAWNNVVNRPTTLSGYGITDALTANSDLNFYRITNRPNTLMAYGISDGLSTSSSLNWNNVVNRPTTLSGYGITDGFFDPYTTIKLDTMKTGSYLTSAYGNGRFVTVNYSSTRSLSYVMVSRDGVNWDSATTLFMQNLLNVRFVNNLFFTLSCNFTGTPNDSLAYSADGYNWTKASIGTTGAGMYGIAYGNGRYVAVGSRTNIFGTPNNSIAWSIDGLNWTSISGPELSNVVFAFGKFIGLSTSGIRHSTDGLTWTSSYTASCSFMHFCYGDRMIIAVCSNGSYIVSTNGTTWTIPTVTGISFSSGLRGIAYGNGRYVAVRASTSNNIFTSTDGLNWTNISVNQSWANPLYCTYGNGKFVINNGLRVITLGSLIEPIAY